jgi:hypothetical protein
MATFRRREDECERCFHRDATVRFDRERRKWYCQDCWQAVGLLPGTPVHPEDRPGWKIEVRRRLD